MDYRTSWSEWRDLNPRPLGPEPSAIPNFATPRKHDYYSPLIPVCQAKSEQYTEIFCGLMQKRMRAFISRRGGCLCRGTEKGSALFHTRESLNKSPAAVVGSFSSAFRFEKLEILRSRWRQRSLTDAACPLRVHKVFLRFSNLNPPKNLSTSALADLIRASLESVKKLEKLFIAPRARQILHETAQRAFARCECA